ncbi:MAG: hypothetical protein GXO96_06345 [Nitrospirae bacterium]|nr:hypothetical protein [Candidatus Manganitrophaceae bacterium]
MFKIQWHFLFLMCFFLLVIPQEGFSKKLSIEEVNTIWENFLRKEQYRQFGFTLESKFDAPMFGNRIIVKELRGGYLGGFFGLSEGGGWGIVGGLEAEVTIEEGILQLYVKETVKTSPGLDLFFIVIQSGYDKKKYPIYEFRLILRDTREREQIKTLKSINLPKEEVFVPLYSERRPRGKIDYDPEKKVAVVRIESIRNPFSVEVPLLEFF